MKIRNGFVSNSSSSSFIVHDINKLGSKTYNGLLDKKTIQKLLKFGFIPNGLLHPTHLEYNSLSDESLWDPLVDKKTKEILVRSFGYYVSCNQDEVIRFLVKNNIGFSALIHYGHYFYLFHKNDKHIMVFKNFGAEVETYRQEDSWKTIVKEFKRYNEPSYQLISIKEFLKNENP